VLDKTLSEIPDFPHKVLMQLFVSLVVRVIEAYLHGFLKGKMLNCILTKELQSLAELIRITAIRAFGREPADQREEGFVLPVNLLISQTVSLIPGDSGCYIIHITPPPFQWKCSSLPEYKTESDSKLKSKCVKK